MKKFRFTAIAALLLIFLLLPLILSSCAPKQIYSIGQGKWIARFRNDLNIVEPPYLVFYNTSPIETSFTASQWKGKLLTEDGWQAVTVDIDYDSLKVIDGEGNVVLAGKLRNPSTVARDQAIYLDLTVDNLNLSTRGDDLPFDYFVGVQEYDGVPTFEEIAQMQQDTSAQ